ncbi:DUF2135 family protein, function uncharacterised [Escherichia coli]|uniref:DUF2135 family protein, function uncharacterized n=10 Tax=root TaxID=1 RepID=A0A376SBZ5_ECOLX|nr:DUF2135 family protein, function uncharacterised [Escherichia coli]
MLCERFFFRCYWWRFRPVAHGEGVQEVEIDAPLSGWHPAEGEDASFSQSINYPASSVNMADDQNISAQIRGKIKNYAAAGKVQQGRLVVNGASMPQRIESDVHLHALIFSLKAATACRSSALMGKADKKMQFYSTPGAGVIRARLRLVLSWDTDNTDLDLHVVTPDGEHAWYGNTVLKNSGALDMDVTTGYGPEIFAMPAPIHGRYQVYINYYGGRSETELTTAQLTLITDEGSVNEKQETFIVPMRNAGELTLVKSFDW